ncbi:uncharacterized protein LOC143964396 isoform X2 [Lithobates pipiens]
MMESQFTDEHRNRQDKPDHKPQHVDMCKAVFLSGGNNKKLPMSPTIEPSKLCLDDSEMLSLQVTTADSTTNSKTSHYPLDQVDDCTVILLTT